MLFETPEAGQIRQLAHEDFCRLLPKGNTLHDNLHFMHKLLDTIPFPVYVKNSMGVYMACNQAFEEYLGVRRKQVLGKTARECGHNGLDFTGNGTAHDLLTGRGTRTYETSIVSSDGMLRDLICSKSVYLNPDGTIGGIIGSIFDVTGHKHTKGLLDNLKFMQTLIDTIPCPIFYKDTIGIYLGCNKALEGYLNKPREEIIGRTDYDLVPKSVADKY